MEPQRQNFEVTYKQRYTDLHNTRTSLRALERQKQAAPEASEMQAVRSKLEEPDRRNEHVVQTVAERIDEVLQRAEALGIIEN